MIRFVWGRGQNEPSWAGWVGEPGCGAPSVGADWSDDGCPGSQVVKLLRRALSAVTLAVAVAAALRVRGSGGTPPEHGGWRPLELPER